MIIDVNEKTYMSDVMVAIPLNATCQMETQDMQDKRHCRVSISCSLPFCRNGVKVISVRPLPVLKQPI